MKLLFTGLLLTYNLFGGFYCLKPKALGDAEQQAGIIWFLNKKPEIVDETNVTELLEKIRVDKEKIILLTTGNSGVSFITEHADLLKDATVIHTSHILDDKCKSLLGLVDLLAVPSYSVKNISDTVGKTKILRTTGVAHLTILESNLGILKQKLGLKGDKFSLKIMGGDAPDEKGVMQFYTTKEPFGVRSEAITDEELIPDAGTLLISNGPRTGLYGVDERKIKSAHRDGKVDYVTQAYVNAFKKVLRAKKHRSVALKVIDFQFDVKGPSIAELFSLVKLTRGKIIVAGESTTLLSKAFDTFPGEVIVEVNTATNSTHLKHVKSEHNRYAKVLGRMLRFCEIDLGEGLPKKAVIPVLEGNTSVAAHEIAEVVKGFIKE